MSWARKLLRGSAFALLAVVLLYYLGVNALLASPLGPALLNAKPELFQFRYDRAWTVVPGRLQVRGFQLSTQDRNVHVMITADRVHGVIHLETLAELRLFATDVEADGVTMHVRSRVKPGDEKRAHLNEQPPIAGYESAVLTPDELARPLGPLLVLEFKDLTVHHLREVWIDRLRYTGDAEVEGGMRYEPLTRLRLDAAYVTDANSKLSLDEVEVPIERLEAHVTLEALDLVTPRPSDFRKLTADLQLSASVVPRFLNAYLTNVKGLSTLQVSGAPGPLDISLKVERGTVADGAVLTYATPRAALRIPFVEVAGGAAVKGTTKDGKLRLDVELSGTTLRQHDGERLAEAARFALLASSTADLTKLDTVDARLLLSGGRVPALTSLNQFIPPGAGLRVVEGEGLLEAKLSIDSASSLAQGTLALTANSVLVKNRSASLEGRLVVKGEVRSLNLKTGALDLSGSEVAIDGATLRAEGRSWPLWVRAVAEACVLTPQNKVRWSAKLALGASNLQPLLAIVGANVPLPRVLNVLTDSPNLRAEAELTVREGSIDLPRLVLTSQHVRAEASMSLRDAGDDRLEPWGSALVHAGVFSAGVQFDGPKRSLVLFDLRKWAVDKKLPQ